MKLEQYPKYKESGVPWIKKIPVHWDVLPNRAIFEERNTRGMIDEDLLSVTIKRGVIRQKELIESSSKKDSSNEDKSKYKLVMEGDLPYNKMRMWQGAVGVSKYRGIVSPAYIILKPRENAHADYFHYLLRTTEYTKESQRYSYGICDDQLSLRFKDFKVIKSILPSVDEQKIIASFIRSKERKIAKFIRNKRRLIKLLQEQIYSMVLTGNGKAPIRNESWLDCFLSHWKTEKAKWIFQEVKIKNKPEKGLLAVTQDRGVLPKKLCEQKYVSPSGDLSGLKLVRAGDYVISLRSFQGGIEYSQYEGIVSPAYNVFSLRKDYESFELKQFYRYLFKTKRFIGLLNTIISGIRDGKNISFEDFSKLELPIPPIKELNNFIRVSEKYEKFCNRFEAEKNLLNEYRMRFISDVVTGKVDVRNIKVEDVPDEELVDDLSPTEEIKEPEGSVEEVPDED